MLIATTVVSSPSNTINKISKPPKNLSIKPCKKWIWEISKITCKVNLDPRNATKTNQWKALMISLVGSETSAVRKNVRYFCFSVMMKSSIPQLNYKRTFIELLQLYWKQGDNFPWKYQKTKAYMMFSEGIKREHWP